jgi:cytoskeletal protein CcmA (bactofilin family)
MSSDSVQWGWKSVNPKGSPAPEVEEAPARHAGTFIGSGALFEGTLSLQGDFRIDSEFRGELCTDGKIVVGPTGSVVGDIHAREVEVLGAVVGNVSARRQLILHKGCRVHGDLETACLEVERHAFFQGATRMTEPQARRDERPVAPQASAATLA